MMEYKGYLGKVEFDDEAGVFHGDVINTRDVITFQGETVAELMQAFMIPSTIISRFATREERLRRSLSPGSS